MKDKTYEVTINASKEKVWDAMVCEDTYKLWVKGFSENAEFVGEWVQGTKIDFMDPGKGGTRAILEVVDKPNRILAKHIAMLNKEREVEENGSEKWVGTLEEYVLTEENGVTTVTVNMHFHKDFEKMFDKGWDASLKLLKELCEK